MPFAHRMGEGVRRTDEGRGENFSDPDGCDWYRGARASGVWFSASRRKPRPAKLSPLEISGSVGYESSGATPELARETRALPSNLGLPLDVGGFMNLTP
jgi:hypothetical protein